MWPSHAILKLFNLIVAFGFLEFVIFCSFAFLAKIDLQLLLTLTLQA